MTIRYLRTEVLNYLITQYDYHPRNLQIKRSFSHSNEGSEKRPVSFGWRQANDCRNFILTDKRLPKFH